MDGHLNARLIIPDTRGCWHAPGMSSITPLLPGCRRRHRRERVGRRAADVQSYRHHNTARAAGGGRRRVRLRRPRRPAADHCDNRYLIIEVMSWRCRRHWVAAVQAIMTSCCSRGSTVSQRVGWRPAGVREAPRRPPHPAPRPAPVAPSPGTPTGCPQLVVTCRETVTVF